MAAFYPSLSGHSFCGLDTGVSHSEQASASRLVRPKAIMYIMASSLTLPQESAPGACDAMLAVHPAAARRHPPCRVAGHSHAHSWDLSVDSLVGGTEALGH